MSRFDAIREESCAANAALPAAGLVDLTFGNVSVCDREAGVFAIKPIPKGVNPLKSKMKYKDVPFTHKELKGVPASVKKQMKIFCYFDKDKFLVPSLGLNSMDLAVYLNHSKNPNVQFKKNDKLVTLKSIKVGEELMMDYDLTFGEKHTFK